VEILITYFTSLEALRSVLLSKYYSDDQIENNEMSGACGMYGGKERCIEDYGWVPEGKRPLVRSKHSLGE
jgi:hypothetical protein